jgi:hypothetical protein
MSAVGQARITSHLQQIMNAVYVLLLEYLPRLCICPNILQPCAYVPAVQNSTIER